MWCDGEDVKREIVETLPGRNRVQGEGALLRKEHLSRTSPHLLDRPTTKHASIAFQEHTSSLSINDQHQSEVCIVELSFAASLREFGIKSVSSTEQLFVDMKCVLDPRGIHTFGMSRPKSHTLSSCRVEYCDAFVARELRKQVVQDAPLVVGCGIATNATVCF